MAVRGAVRVGLEPEQRRSGLGSVPGRKLDLAGLLRLELGRLGAVGLGAVSLWPLVQPPGIRVVLVSGTALQPLLLAARPGGVLRLWAWSGRGRRVRLDPLGAARSARALPSLVRERRPRHPRDERDQYPEHLHQRARWQRDLWRGRGSVRARRPSGRAAPDRTGANVGGARAGSGGAYGGQLAHDQPFGAGAAEHVGTDSVLFAADRGRERRGAG